MPNVRCTACGHLQRWRNVKGSHLIDESCEECGGQVRLDRRKRKGVEEIMAELMRRPDYSHGKVVYFTPDNPPKCVTCGRDVLDEIHITDKVTGEVFCIDHAPHLPGQRTLEAFTR